MKILKMIGLVCVLLAVSFPVQAQFVQSPDDYGVADTIDLVFTVVPDVATSQFKLQADLWVVDDANELAGASMGFSWDNPQMLMDSAKFMQVILSGFDGPKFLYDRNEVDSTNLYQRFQCIVARIRGAGIPLSTSRQQWASYYFSLSQWSLTDSVIIDTMSWDDGTIVSFLGMADENYAPYWTGRKRVRDSAYKPPSNLVLSTQTLSFVAVQEQPSPPNQPVQITSDDSPLSFTVEENVGWLLKSPSSGTTPATVNVGVNAFGLAVGTYKDSLAIVAPHAANTPQYVVVYLTVEPPPPEIGVSADTFLFKAVLDGANPPSRQLDVFNAGGSTLNWTATNSESWLMISPTSGVDAGSITLDVDITGLPWGEYTDYIEISDPNATNSPYEVEVHLSLASGLPEISVDPQTKYIVINLPPDDPVAQVSGPPPLDVPPAYFTVENSGGGTLDFSVSESSSMIYSISPTTGTAPQEIEVTFKISSSLAAGTYRDTIWVTSAEATNSPYPVVFVYYANPYPQNIYCNKDTVVLYSYECVDGTISGLPTTNFRIVNNGGDNPMNMELLYESDYFYVDTTMGTAPAVFNLYPKSGDIPLGTYYDTIQVWAPRAMNSPFPVIVKFEVLPSPQEPAIHTLPETEVFIAAKEDSGPFASSGCRVFNEYYGCMDWAITGGAPWAVPSRTSGGVPGFIGFIVDPTGYPMGRYVDTFYVTSSSGTNSPKKMLISLNVWRFRGDVTWDGKINLADITRLIGYVYLHGAPPIPITAIGDVNCDSKINLGDITALIACVYLHQPLPCD